MRTHGLPSTYRRGCRCAPCRAAHTTACRSLRRRNREALDAGTAELTHGTANAYRNWGCRCEPCREANSAKIRAFRERRRRALADDPAAAPHGQASTYDNWCCRCEPCTTAHAARRGPAADQPGGVTRPYSPPEAAADGR